MDIGCRQEAGRRQEEEGKERGEGKRKGPCTYLYMYVHSRQLPNPNHTELFYSSSGRGCMNSLLSYRSRLTSGSSHHPTIYAHSSLSPLSFPLYLSLSLSLTLSQMICVRFLPGV